MGNPNTKSTNKRFGVQGPTAEEERAAGALVVRDWFPETLLWAPNVVTDTQGHAKIMVPFADSITTWRLDLRAISRAGQLGSTTAPLVVKQDFFVDAALPPSLTQGDEIAVPVSVFSYLATEQDVTVEVEGDGLTPVGEARAVVHLGPKETRGIRWMVKADRAGERKLRVKATGPTRADALERTVLVVPNGMPFTRTVNGRVVHAASSTIELPANAIDGGNDLWVKVYGGALSQVSEGLDGVFRLPHGCFEQTSSTTYPSILALDFLKRTKTVSPEVEKKARGYIQEGFQRIVSFEVPGSGGFSLFGKAPASTTLSAYGLMELADLARVTGGGDDQVLRRTRAFLYEKRRDYVGWPKPLSDPKDDVAPRPNDPATTAFIAWALALANEALPADKDDKLGVILDALLSPPGDGDAYVLALRANALLAGKRGEAARPLLDKLAALAVRDDDGVHWTSSSVGVLYSYGASMDVEVTGLATHALALAGRDLELRSGALAWLVQRRGPYGAWSTTPATLAALRALLDEARPTPKEPQDISVLADGALVESFRMEPKARDVHRLVSLRSAAATGKHTIEVKATGEADVAYQVVGMHWLPWQRRKGDDALALDVSYAPTTVAAGQVSVAHVRLGWRGKEPARMPLVELAIPPAFDVETSDLDKLVARPDGRIQRYTVEPRKVTLYLVDLPPGSPLIVDVPLRAIRTARVVASSSDAYLYYEPDKRAETQPVPMRIE